MRGGEPLGELRALTLWQPWAWAIAEGGKNIENRPWPLPLDYMNRWVALHAAARNKKRDIGQRQLLRTIACARECPPLDELQYSAIIALFQVNGQIRSVEEAEGSPWYFKGQVGWKVSRVALLPRPVPCRGFQKLWRVPLHVEEAIQAQGVVEGLR